MNLQDIKLDVRTAVAVVMGCFAIYFYFDARYAYRSYVERVEVASQASDLELKRQELENELNRDHFARRQYEEQITNGTASPRDLVRHEYLLLEIDNKVAEKKIVDKQIAELGKAKTAGNE